MSSIKVYSPYDEHFIREIPKHTQQQAEQALATAHACFDDRTQWLPKPERVTILQKTVSLMKARHEVLAKAAAEEGGKPLIDSRVEVTRAINGVEIALEHISHMKGAEIPMNLSATSVNRMAYTFHQPRGVVLAISAFNHPLNLIVHQVIPAIAVGCPVIVKPASSTPLSCCNMLDILYEAGLPQSWAQMLCVDNQIAEGLVKDERISFLSFIGSGKVGWHLRSLLAPGASCALEHGGAAPVIVESDADLDDAIPLLVKGGFYHAGQVCVSVQRIFAHKKIAKKLAKQLASQAEKLIVGDPLDEKTEVGPLIEPSVVARLDEWVEEAIKGGAKLLCGGKALSKTCYAPTVLLDPPDEAKVSCEEIFGPVVCVYSTQDRSEALKRANQVPFAFQAAIFTNDLNAALDGIHQLEAMTVMVNDHTAFRVDWMPFGGRKHSGLNVGGIPQSMQDMTYEKLFVLRSEYAK